MKKLLLALGAIGIMMLIATLLAWPLMVLWNWEMTSIFSLREISFFEALGLLVISGTLFRNGHSSNK